MCLRIRRRDYFGDVVSGCACAGSGFRILGRSGTVPDAFPIQANYNQRIMGTSSDWAKVAILSIWFPAFMILAVFILRAKPPAIKPMLTPFYVSSWAFTGLFFGILNTFGWNAFRWPLVSLLVGSVMGIVVFGKLAQRKLRSAPMSNKSEAGSQSSATLSVV